MKNSLKIILWIVVTLLFSWLVILALKQFPKLFPIDGFFFAFELHFILMAWYAFSLSKLNLNYRSSYYNLKPFELNGRLYKYLGVNIFRAFLKVIGWNKISDQSNGRVIKNLERIKKREKHTREAEFAHAILFLHFIVIALYFSSKYNVFWLLFLNVILHLFPIFIQRYNRPRYSRILDKFQS